MLNSGPWFNIKMPSYQYRKSHCGDKTVVRSYLSPQYYGISFTGKTTSLYWIRVLVPVWSIAWCYQDIHKNQLTRNCQNHWNTDQVAIVKQNMMFDFEFRSDPWPNFNDSFAVWFRAMMNNYIPHKTVEIITHPCLNLPLCIYFQRCRIPAWVAARCPSSSAREVPRGLHLWRG